MLTPHNDPPSSEWRAGDWGLEGSDGHLTAKRPVWARAPLGDAHAWLGQA